MKEHKPRTKLSLKGEQPPRLPAKEAESVPFNPSAIRAQANHALDDLKQSVRGMGASPSEISGTWQQARLAHDAVQAGLLEYRNASDAAGREAAEKKVRAALITLEGDASENVHESLQGIIAERPRATGTLSRQGLSRRNERAIEHAIREYPAAEAAAYREESAARMRAIRERITALEGAARSGKKTEAEILALESELRDIERKRSMQARPEAAPAEVVPEPVQAVQPAEAIETGMPLEALKTAVREEAASVPEEPLPDNERKALSEAIAEIEEISHQAPEKGVSKEGKEAASDRRWEGEYLRWEEYCKERSAQLDAKAESLGAQAGRYAKSLGGWYKRQPLWLKLGFSAVLIGGSIVTGGSGAWFWAISSAMAGQRVLGGLGTYVALEGFLGRRNAKKESRWNSVVGRNLIAATAGALVGSGALGALFHEAGSMAANTEAGHAAREFLASHWPFGVENAPAGGQGGAGPTNEVPAGARIAPEPPEVPQPEFAAVESARAGRGDGAIKLFAHLQENLRHAYASKPMPDSVKHLLESNPTKLAQEYGFYKPGEVAESGLILRGSELSFTDKGELVFTQHGGSPTVLSDSTRFEGRFFDTDAPRADVPSGAVSAHQTLDQLEDARTAELNRAQAELIREANAESAARAAANEVPTRGPTYNDTLGKMRLPRHDLAPAEVVPPEAASSAVAHVPFAEQIRSHGVTPQSVDEAVRAAPGMQPDPSLMQYVEPNTGTIPGPAVFLGQDGSLTVYGASATGDNFEAQKAVAARFAAASGKPVNVLLPDGARGHLVISPDGSEAQKTPGFFRSYKPPLAVAQSVYVFPR